MNRKALGALVALSAIALFAAGSSAQAKKTAAAPAAAPAPAKSATLDRIKASGKLKLGYRTDARPFSFKDESGNAAGYSVGLCTTAADAIKASLAPTNVAVEWVPVAVADRFSAVQSGQVDLFCGADTETLTRRQDVAFSIPIFPSGIGALLRSDASTRLKDILAGKHDTDPHWRASAGALVQGQTFAVINGTTAQTWLDRRLNSFQLTAKVTPVAGYDEGIQAVLDRKANVFFGDRAILLDAAARHASTGDLVVLDRYFTYEPLALTMARNDDAFRLVVDRAIAKFYKSEQFTVLYVKWFGAPGTATQTFFAWNTLSE